MILVYDLSNKWIIYYQNSANPKMILKNESYLLRKGKWFNHIRFKAQQNIIAQIRNFFKFAT